MPFLKHKKNFKQPNLPPKRIRKTEKKKNKKQQPKVSRRKQGNNKDQRGNK